MLGTGYQPINLVLDQEELRPHLVKSLETNTVTAFPVLKHGRPANRVRKVEVCFLFWHRRLPDNGDRMVCCESCDELFHAHCIDNPPINA